MHCTICKCSICMNETFYNKSCIFVFILNLFNYYAYLRKKNFLQYNFELNRLVFTHVVWIKTRKINEWIMRKKNGPKTVKKNYFTNTVKKLKKSISSFKLCKKKSPTEDPTSMLVIGKYIIAAYQILFHSAWNGITANVIIKFVHINQNIHRGKEWQKINQGFS